MDAEERTVGTCVRLDSTAAVAVARFQNWRAKSAKPKRYFGWDSSWKRCGEEDGQLLPGSVHELKRTITQHSVAARSTRSAGTHAQENVPKPSSDRNSVSENTIVIDTEQEDFDFEQVLKDIVKK